METQFILARTLILVLSTAFAGGIIARKLKLPLMVGYLLSGIIAGNLLSNYFQIGESIKSIAELGIILLLFTMGLEFSLARLKEFGEVIIFGSLVQVLLCIVVSVILYPMLGMDFYTSLFLGAAFSLSSTAVVLKSLSDRGELETLHGELSSGWLFMQDLYTLPLIIVLVAVGGMIKGDNVGILAFFTFAKSIILAFVSFLVILIMGKRTVPFFIEKIADVKSRELLIIASVLFCLLFAYIFNFLGLSYALGAFLAGILLSSSSSHHGIFAEIRPLRDLFATVFFVSLGFIVNPAFIISNWSIILTFVILVISIKFLISVILVFLLGYHTKTAALVGVSLISVGEFAFILAIMGISGKLISYENYMIIISVSFITLILAVPVIAVSDKVYYILRSFVKNKFPGLHIFIQRKTDRMPETHTFDLMDHVVVLGHGRVGKYICRALSYSNISYVVVDYNHKLVKYLRSQGVNVIYGDPAEIDVLKFARIKNAKAVIIAYADRHTQESVVLNILSLNSGVKIICRTHFDEDGKKLKSLGVDAVIQPEFEAAISMTEKLLGHLHHNPKEIEEKLRNIRSNQGL